MSYLWYTCLSGGGEGEESLIRIRYWNCDYLTIVVLVISPDEAVILSCSECYTGITLDFTTGM